MGREKSSIAFYYYGEIFLCYKSTNQNLFSCKQVSSFKPRVHRVSTESQKVTDQSNAGLFSKSQIQLDMESINALSRVAQAQQQQECFNLSSKVNDTVYAAPPKGNCSVTTTRYIT